MFNEAQTLLDQAPPTLAGAEDSEDGGQGEQHHAGVIDVEIAVDQRHELRCGAERRVHRLDARPPEERQHGHGAGHEQRNERQQKYDEGNVENNAEPFRDDANHALLLATESKRFYAAC